MLFRSLVLEYGVVRSISQGQKTSSSATYDVDVSASAVAWGKFDIGGTYSVCMGPYCLNLTAPVPVLCGNNYIDPGSDEVCDGNPVVYDDFCDDPVADGCDWGPTGSMTHGCEDIDGILGNPDECLDDFNPPTDDPPWPQACCVFWEMFNFKLAWREDVVVY